MALGKNFIKESVESLDEWIQKMQITIFEGLNFDEFNGYGRVYIVEKDKKKIPAHFLEGSDYKEVLTDDCNNGHFFCIEGDTSDVVSKQHVEADVEWIFLVNVAELLPEIKHRADVEVRKLIHQQIAKCNYFVLEKIVIGKKALSALDTVVTDMQPYHIISFQGKIKYQFNC